MKWTASSGGFRTRLSGGVASCSDAPADVRWLDGIDGLLIGGSGDYSVHHPQSQRWVNPMRVVLDAALQRRMPGFGLCFGHQLLGLHLVVLL